MNYVKIYIVTLILFVLIDGIWLGFIARGLYAKELGFILSSNPKWISAILFYAIYVGGLCYFAVIPALSNHNYKLALINGMVLSFIAYSTYDLTNLATIENWPVKVTIIDMIWGSFLGGTVSLASYNILNMFTIK